jgi:glutamine synthetase
VTTGHGWAKPAPPEAELDRERLAELIAAGAIGEVVVALPDLQGRLQGARVAAGHFLDEVVDRGFPACTYLLACDAEMRPVPGGALDPDRTGWGDLLLRPDLSTLRTLPWDPGTALVLADAHHRDGTAVAVAPRQVLRRQLERLAARGLRALVGLELELRVFRQTYDEVHAGGYTDLRPASRGSVDYALAGLDGLEPVVGPIRRAMTAAGLHIESARGECAPGQYEITFRYRDALGACDDAVLYKSAARQLAATAGAAVTFMAKVDGDEGSSAHIHCSLRGADDDRPVLAADGRGEGWSPALGHAVAGTVATMAELSLCMAPGLNSWKRLQPGGFAPHTASWGPDDRTAAVRVVGEGASLRLEHRLPGADANPYLSVAAVLAGMQHGLDTRPPLPEPGPAAGEPLPRHLHGALGAWKRSAVARDAFGPDVVAHLAAAARHELAAFAGTVTDWERRRGFERA